jgi:3-phosphoshikimate 1-carboxyvinyltransferase
MVEWMKSGLDIVDVGAAGTAMRFSTALLSVREGCRVITGSPRMKQRPISVLVDALRELGANVEYMETEGFPPLKVFGNPNMRGGCLCVPGGISSQYISALLMIAPCLMDGLTLHLKGNIASRTYIELTLGLMRKYGAMSGWTDEQTIRVAPGAYEDVPLTVEADWSAASYWYELAAIATHHGHEVEIILPGLMPDSQQGDRVVAQLFEPLGVRTEYIEEGARLRLSECNNQNSGLTELDFTHCPDIAQTLAVTHCLLGIPYIYKGIHSLRIKETDRVAALIAELRKLGFVLRAEGDECLIWDGTRCAPDPQPTIATYDDHRMAMAFAPAALCYDGLTIEHPEVVTKSYPSFWEHLKQWTNGIDSGK